MTIIELSILKSGRGFINYRDKLLLIQDQRRVPLRSVSLTETGVCRLSRTLDRRISLEK